MLEPQQYDFGGQVTRGAYVVASSVWNGLSTDPTLLWAFFRAQRTAFANTPFRHPHGAPVVMAQVRQLDPRWAGLTRMQALVRGVVKQLNPVLAACAGRRIGVALALPEDMGPHTLRKVRGGLSALEETVRAEVEAQGGPAGCAVHTEARGHAAGAYCVMQAAHAVASGALDVTIVLGVDTYYDPAIVAQLLAEERILDTKAHDAFLPGEGAAALVLAAGDITGSRRWSAMAEVRAVGTCDEPATLDNDTRMLGMGLSRACHAATAKLRRAGGELDWWMTDMTPEHLRAREFQLAWPRVAQGLMPPTATLDHLPSQLGDLGAASIPTGIALACESFRHSGSSARNCLVTASSVGHARAAVLVHACGAPGDAPHG
ncbi:MAG: hypothetical protein R3B40_29390 [Polyangiales bacterium]